MPDRDDDKDMFIRHLTQLGVGLEGYVNSLSPTQERDVEER